MITAIFFMVAIATILTAMLSSTASSTQTTIDAYISEQAELMAKSATELAVLKVLEHDRSTGCLTGFSAQYPGVNPILDISVSIRYIGLNCSNAAANYVADIDTPESNGTMLIDVVVKSNSSLHLSEPVRYCRRTLQKL